MFFRYAYRSLLARGRASAVTMLAVALFVAGGTLGLAYYLNLSRLLVTAAPENVIVVSKGAASEAESKLALDSARKLMVLDGIAQENGQPRAARELVSHVFVSRNYGTYEEPSAIRGIDARSLSVHGAKVIEGTAPQPGTSEILVGKRLAARYPHLTIGAEVALPKGPGKISGIFTASGSSFEDELWIAREALELQIAAKTSSSVTFVAADAARAKALVASINASKDIDAQAQTVAEFRAEKGGLRTVARAVIVLLLLLSIVATFAIATTLNAAVQMRRPELGALAAIGIRRSTLGRVVLVESVTVAVVGALLGIAIAVVVGSLVGRMPVGTNPVEISMSSTTILAGLLLGAIVGILGGVLPMLQVRRLDILHALR